MRVSDSEVGVWLADLGAGAEQVEQLARLLTEDERRRAGRFRRPDDRRRFIVAHAFVRQVLGFHTGISPRALEFLQEPYGKPMLAHTTRLQFNLSHSYDVAAVAVTCGRRVGIDVEVMRADLDIRSVAPHCFRASEIQRIVGGRDVYRRFYEHWTGKEAYLKAQGDGLSAPLHGFEVTFDSEGNAGLLIDSDCERGRWAVRIFEPRADLVCAVAAEGHDWDVRPAEWISIGSERD